MLHEEGGQLHVREDVVEHHRLLWEQCILEEVRFEDSVWHDLYGGDCFSFLEVHILGNTPWDDLSKSQQEKVVLESLRSVEVKVYFHLHTSKGLQNHFLLLGL